MVTINLRNIEEILFNKTDLNKKLPEFRHYFDVWRLGQQHPHLKPLAKQAVLDVIRNIQERQIDILEQHFKTSVTIDKLDNRIVKNYHFSIENVEENLAQGEMFADMALYREGDQLYVSFWL